MDCSTPCPSLSPGVCSNSCLLSQWCHPTISCSIAPFSCALSFPALQSFPMSQLFTLGGQSVELQLQHQFFQWIFKVNFFKDWLFWSPCCPRDFQEYSPASQFKSINSLALRLLYGSMLSYLYMTTGKIMALTIWTFNKVMSLLFHMQSRFIIAFLPKSKVFSFHGCSHHLQWFWSPAE